MSSIIMEHYYYLTDNYSIGLFHHISIHPPLRNTIIMSLGELSGCLRGVLIIN